MLCFKQQLGSAEAPQFLPDVDYMLWYIFNETEWTP